MALSLPALLSDIVANPAQIVPRPHPRPPTLLSPRHAPNCIQIPRRYSLCYLTSFWSITLLMVYDRSTGPFCYQSRCAKLPVLQGSAGGYWCFSTPPFAAPLLTALLAARAARSGRRTPHKSGAVPFCAPVRRLRALVGAGLQAADGAARLAGVRSALRAIGGPPGPSGARLSPPEGPARLRRCSFERSSVRIDPGDAAPSGSAGPARAHRCPPLALRPGLTRPRR